MSIESTARNKVTHALKKKLLFKKPCEVCEDTIGEAHHDDYTKPLDVRWLCRKHHASQHKTAWKSGQDKASLNKRNNAIWYMYVEVGYSMQEIGDIYHISKTMVHQIINSQAQKRADQIKKI